MIQSQFAAWENGFGRTHNKRLGEIIRTLSESVPLIHAKPAIRLFGMCFDPSQPVILFFLCLTVTKGSTKLLISDATRNIDFYVIVA